MHFCLQHYVLFTLLLTLHIIYLLHMLSTNHKCTQPCYFSLLLKLDAQKEKMGRNYLTRSSRLCVAPVAIPVVLWSLLVFRFIKSHLSLYRHYLCNNYTLYSWHLVIYEHFCLYVWNNWSWSCIRWVLGFDIKLGMTSCSAFRCFWHAKCRRTIFCARMGPLWIPQKVRWGMLHQTCVCIQWDFWFTLCIPVCLAHESSTQYFSCSGVTGTKWPSFC
jgi:hypothetical protein